MCKIFTIYLHWQYSIYLIKPQSVNIEKIYNVYVKCSESNLFRNVYLTFILMIYPYTKATQNVMLIYDKISQRIMISGIFSLQYTTPIFRIF